MGKTDGGKKISTMDNLSLTIPANEFSRDLLQRFTGCAGESGTVIEEDGGIELNLGLSLGGRFGVDKCMSKLHRSSSIASCLPIVRDDDSSDTAAPFPAPAACTTALVRTSSLPLEAEEEWRKRKEWQTLRRLEAKRRRSEKQRNISGSLSLAAGSGIDVAMVKGKGRFLGSDGKHGFENLVPSSSNMADIGNKTPPQGCHDEPNPASNLDATSKSTANTNITTGPKPKSPSRRPTTSKSNSLEEMPCVFTRGDGPNGKRVDGILYKYGKGQDVRIMCVCHGTFHSPAEFIKHAGGTDVDHPLKHIVVNQNTSPML